MKSYAHYWSSNCSGYTMDYASTKDDFCPRFCVIALEKNLGWERPGYEGTDHHKIVTDCMAWLRVQ